ncbi:MAG: MBL fold metallo-hydrolase [Eubacteriales bacterium]|nr:MBL fold metallo-hydrolase [Eubacteriales bacterium]
MEKLIALGTGNAMVTHCYNTCFALNNEQGTVLVDAGGGNGILAQIERAKIDWTSIHDFVITHAHCDHLTGAVWVLRKIATMMLNDKYDGVLHIYAHQSVLHGLKMMAELMLQSKFVKLIGTQILFVALHDGKQAALCGRAFTFFDIGSTKLLQFGFRMILENGEVLIFLGDEPYNPACRANPQNADWVLCEAFCLYAERERFKPYEKHHSTVKDACELAQSLHIKNLVLWHTEDTQILQRKKLYTEEGKAFYTGALYVPNDLDEILLEDKPS